MDKYLKYKLKYLTLKKQLYGGSHINILTICNTDYTNNYIHNYFYDINIPYIETSTTLDKLHTIDKFNYFDYIYIINCGKIDIDNVKYISTMLKQSKGILYIEEFPPQIDIIRKQLSPDLFILLPTKEEIEQVVNKISLETRYNPKILVDYKFLFQLIKDYNLTYKLHETYNINYVDERSQVFVLHNKKYTGSYYQIGNSSTEKFDFEFSIINNKLIIHTYNEDHIKKNKLKEFEDFAQKNGITEIEIYDIYIEKYFILNILSNFKSKLLEVGYSYPQKYNLSSEKIVDHDTLLDMNIELFAGYIHKYSLQKCKSMSESYKYKEQIFSKINDYFDNKKYINEDFKLNLTVYDYFLKIRDFYKEDFEINRLDSDINQFIQILNQCEFLYNDHSYLIKKL